MQCVVYLFRAVGGGSPLQELPLPNISILNAYTNFKMGWFVGGGGLVGGWVVERDK